MAHIDYYMFTLSPFTYLAGSRLEEIAVRNGATINYKPFNLMQVFEKTGGTPQKIAIFLDRYIVLKKYAESQCITICK